LPAPGRGDVVNDSFTSSGDMNDPFMSPDHLVLPAPLSWVDLP